MNRRTILPTVFELFGFDSYPLDFLKSDLRPWAPNYSVADSAFPIEFLEITGETVAVSPNWLPLINVPGGETSLGEHVCNLEICFYLRYVETSLPKSNSAYARTSTYHGYVDANGDDKRYGGLEGFDATAGISSLDAYLGEVFAKLISPQADANYQHVTKRIVFETVIELDKSICSTEDLDSLITRKELMAQEVTTGYRGVIHRLVVLLLARMSANTNGEEFNVQFLKDRGFKDVLLDILPSGNPSGKIRHCGFHATKECGWRLLANFGKIEEFFYKKCNFSSSIDSIDTFIQILFEQDSSEGAYNSQIQDYLNRWKYEELVSEEVVLKKTIEYFIYRTLAKDAF